MLFTIGWGEVFRKPKDEVIEYGDLVCLREDGLVHKIETEEDVFNFVGICSNTIGVELSGDCKDLPKDEQCEVEIHGKIWAKTNDSLIKPGTHLEPTTDGKVKIANRTYKPFAIAMTDVINGKVKLFIR